MPRIVQTDWQPPLANLRAARAAAERATTSGGARRHYLSAAIATGGSLLFVSEAAHLYMAEMRV